MAVNGVSDTFFKQQKADTESIKIKINLLYDLNGIMFVHNIELIIEKFISYYTKTIEIFKKNLNYTENLLHITALNGEQFQESFNK